MFFLHMETMANAQEITGTPGSPSATQSLDSKELPAPLLPFGGEINLNAFQSKPFWQPQIVPPKSAPNILLIMTDDVGFGAPSTFGGTIPTPALDRIAKMGLRYTQFHSTALCSPTRAALITGRNHHSVHSGVVSEMSTGYPGYDSLIGKNTATIGEILKQNGYGTSWFGKEHNIPAFQASQAGPFDLWPNAIGFEYFYGFVGGDTSQWEPNLFRNTTPIYPYVGKPGWNLTTAMADEAIDWMKQLNSIAPDKPFFVYYVPGGTHAPHHPTPEWIAKFKGHFDEGWNVEREKIFANQKKLGVIPADAKLTPWPDDILPLWETLSADDKKMFARQAEVYAAYLAYTDHEIGRVIQAVEDMGKLDNTLIIYISGDNGSSAEGSLIGSPNEIAMFNGVEFPVKQQLEEFYNVWGSDKTYPHMAVAWTWAFDTPFKWTKQIASHFGGTRQGLAIAWPKVIKDAGGIRNQFHHIIDIVPTILEVTKIKVPDMVNGVPQKPIEGVSMAYTFDKANAKAPSHHVTQYFEMLGNRAIYHDGWVASTTPLIAPWDLTSKPTKDVANGYKWELYDLTKDWTQYDDLAASNPDKLKEMQELFLVEASKYQVLPLDNSLSERLLAPRPSVTAGRSEFTYSGTLSGIPHGDAPSILDKSYTITAEVEIPKEGAEGMLVTEGGRFGGYGLYLLNGKPVFLYNLVDIERTRWEGKDALTPGKHTLVFDFKYDGGGLGKGGTGVLKIDGKEVDNHRMERSTPFIFQWDETFDVGMDTGTPVEDKDYKVPFKFTGTLNKLTVHLKPEPLSAEDQKKVSIKGQRNNSASE
ncbi:MAG: arylsulfatase [Alphaproteobacteria bacterium]|nr:arylsulfatase [Alphaproteobacteria bacterium]